jgi:hypothetical protein
MEGIRMVCTSLRRVCLFALLFALAAIPALAQQTGSISGKISDSSGGVLPGVTVEARSNVLPGPRATVSGSDGVYQLPGLPPGDYTVSFTLQGMQTATKKVSVALGQNTAVDMAMGVGNVSESVNVTARATLVDKTSAAITSSISATDLRNLPVGTQYRDVIKLLPGIQNTENATRGPSAGSSGQDNVYKFDGVNVTLPLFGTLSAEPASYDIAEINVVKGGAKAVDFDRAGGFLVNSISKSGTNKLTGDASFRFRTASMAAAQVNKGKQFDETSDWTDLDAGGPLVPNHLFFYGSYYRPTESHANSATAYGVVPNFDETRNEGYGKVTYTPIHNALVNVSYRDSKDVQKGASFGAFSSATAGTGNQSRERIFDADGNWILGSSSFISAKFQHYGLDAEGRPDNAVTTPASIAIGSQLDIAHLDQLGLLTVPKVGSNAAVNAFIQPIVNQYGFLCTPQLVAAGSCSNPGDILGGGTVGFNTTFDQDNFFRTSGEIAYNQTVSAWGMRHNLHAGFQRYIDSEDLTRSSNGLGLITVPAGTINLNGTPIFYQAAFQQQGFGTVAPLIHSEYHSNDIEVNDAIEWHDWTINLGLLASHDTIWGQGLQKDSSALSGFVAATATTSAGRKYEEYSVPFNKMLQPRLSATWAYNGKDTIFVSYAKYNPVANSDARAASWDRNLEATINADYDASGKLFAIDPVKSSSGKLYVPNMTPVTHHEIIVGTAKEFSSELSGRAYFRWNRGTHYWEDTNNTARVAFNPPATLPGTDVSIPQTPYIPQLDDYRAQIGSGSSYVIAELDGAFTDYREATLEGDWKSPKGHFVNASFTWSRYYGNFDQDASTTFNDQNIFIGSSNIGDGPGRQLWNNKLGLLHGDVPYVLKMWGAYMLPWQASAGAWIIAQSGNAWEKWDYTIVSNLTSSVSDVDKYAEPAGSRRAPGHAQLDLNYTQRIGFLKRYSGQVEADVFNIFNSQTGYNIDPNFHDAGFSQPQSFYLPRRLEVTLRLTF